MQIRDTVADVDAGLVGGFVGTKIMEPISMKLYEWEPEEARKQEDAVRPGPPYQIAANKIIDRLGLDLSESQRKAVGIAFHYGLGMAWGPMYTFLRRTTNLDPVTAGLVTGRRCR